MLNFDIIKGFLILGLIFIPLERIFTLHKQKIFRSGWKTDILYFFLGNFFSKFGLFLSASITILICELISNESLKLIINNQPNILQFLEAVFIAEIGYYFAHRLTHTNPCLWKFHQIHHSIKKLDWLAAVRVHPLEQIFTKLCQMIPLYFLGFSNKILAIYFLFSAAIAFFIHSNIRLKFSLFKYVIVTPEFHHWHHFIEDQNCNYSAQLPLIDWLFGTFYLPKNKRPQIYGISQPIPLNYYQQLIYPFKQLIKIKTMKSKTSKLSFPLISFLIIILLITLSAVAIPLTTKMSIPTFISSLNSETITIEELDKLRQNDSDSLLLIDVRSPEEYQENHIEKSLLIPLSDIELGFGVKQIKDLIAKKENNGIVVLYCTAGTRSLKAYNILKENNIKTVSLKGGMNAWEKNHQL